MKRHERCVAVVDDEPGMRLALSRLLQVHGFRVVDFGSGREFLASETSGVSCVLLDLHMPELSGFDVLSRFVGRESQPPVIVITGNDEPGHLAYLQSLGAADYLLKPVDQSTLLAAINRLTPAPATAQAPH